MCEPMSVGLWANERAGVGIDDDVLVSGGGPVRLLAASQIGGCFKAIVYPQIDQIEDPGAAFSIGEVN